MAEKRLFNWEIEKKIKEMEPQLQFKEITKDDIENFVLENDYYNGEIDQVYVLLGNANYSRGRFEQANEVFSKLFDKWKVMSNKFPQNELKLKHLADLIISKIDFVPTLMVKFFKKQKDEDLVAVTEYCIDRFETYEKTYLLTDFLEQIPYDGSNPDTLFKLINASGSIEGLSVDEYLTRALSSMKDPISFLNNIRFSAEMFKNIQPETLQKILDLPGITTKFHQFIKYESFMTSLDAIPTLDCEFYINLSNQIFKKDTALAIQYGLRAVQKSDFTIEEHLKLIKCVVEKDPPDKPSVAEILLLKALKEGNYEKIWKIVENSYLIHSHVVEQYDVALKYTGAAVKISQAKSDIIGKHLVFLAKRMRSIDGPEGIMEGDRYKHKEENKKYIQQVEAFKTLYFKRTGKKFMA